ncbi:MAG: hypothetical protein JXA69_17555 [Phycisphaerae bacterium]|nr:hypothetical protein [Phycisphaerae bacterium]
MRTRRISGDSRNEPPILSVKWYDVTKWLLERVESFPKNQRFIFGQRIADRVLNILEVLVEAAYSPRKGDLLARANRDIEVLRWLIRMAIDRKLLTPRQYFIKGGFLVAREEACRQTCYSVGSFCHQSFCPNCSATQRSMVCIGSTSLGIASHLRRSRNDRRIDDRKMNARRTRTTTSGSASPRPLNPTRRDVRRSWTLCVRRESREACGQIRAGGPSSRGRAVLRDHPVVWRVRRQGGQAKKKARPW